MDDYTQNILQSVEAMNDDIQVIHIVPCSMNVNIHWNKPFVET